MQTQLHTKTLQRRLLTLAAGGTIITAAIVALSIAIPLYQYDKQQHQLFLQATTTNRAQIIDEHLDMISYITMQIAARTFAREQLERFQRNEITRAQLRELTAPVLQDAITTNTPQLIGITRLDRDGTALVQVGRMPTAEHWPIPVDETRQSPVITPPIQLDEQQVLLVSAGIYNQEQQRIGTDIAVFSAVTLLRLLDNRHGLRLEETPYLGILHNGEILTIASQGGELANRSEEFSTQLRSALNTGAVGNSGIIPTVKSGGQNNIIAYTPVSDEHPWGLAISVATKELYSSLRERALIILVIVAILVLLALALTINLLRPLTGRILIHNDELQRQINKNTIELQRTNRALSAISACSNALVHARDETSLLREICHIIVSTGGYRMAWIGFAQEDENKSVLPVAQAGFEDGYLESTKITWSENDPYGQSPGGIAIRSGAPSIVRDIRNDARFEPWRDEAGKRGFASVIALPLTFEEKTFGSLMIYSAERDAFDGEEVRLLAELADDLAYGVMILRTRDERKWTEAELIDSEERWRSLTEYSPDHIITLNPALRIEFANYAAPGLKIENLIGTQILDYINDPAKRREVKNKLEETLTNGTPCSYETTYFTPAGKTVYYETRAAPRVVDDAIVGLTLNARDITQRKKDEARIQHLAYHDELTGLANRRLLMDRLKHTLSITKRHNTKGALLFLDLDRFKNINDSLGHATGDAILCEVAKRLQACVRAEDSVARLGGDEFMVLLPELKHEEKDAGYEASVVAEKLRDYLSQAYLLDGHQHYTTPSIGVVIFPLGEETADDILKHADTAMYRAKAAGRNEIRFYHPSMQEAVDRRLDLEKALRATLNEDAFQLYYQPLTDSDNHIVGVEALLRWRRRHDGWISPDEFIPVAEESGIILPLGEWVINHAVDQLARWQIYPWAQQNGFMAINISARQFHQPGFVAGITKALERHNIKPGQLKLELTETLVIEDIIDTVAKMAALRDLGVHIAIDDFGTGYSSLAYLKTLPINQIKIDKSFVLDIPHDSNDAAIVKTIISVAHHLNLGIVAEGVETWEILQTLKQNHCQLFQGFYFSRPLPGNELEAMIEENRAAEPA